jgi:murein DD-endopeptidase MepM/ murein hydrolase activator NlpD
LPAPTSGEKLHVIEVHKLLLREFIPIYESLMSYSALHPEKNLQVQRIAWVMRFLSEGLDIPAFDMVPEDRRLLEEIHSGSVGVIENQRRRIRLQREMSKIIDVLLDQALPPEVRGVLRELSRFGYDMNRPPRDLRTADGLVARTLEIINAMRPTGPILEDNSEYTLLSDDIAVKTEHPGGASRTTLVVANPTPEAKTVDFKRYALQSGRDTQRLGIGGIDSVEWETPSAQYVQLPWRAGEVWRVTQGYHKHIPRSAADDCYAIDFVPLPSESKSVLAMRGGIAVAEVGTPDEKRPAWCPSYARWNPPFRRIVVTHDDGTKAEYWHLAALSSRLLDRGGNPLRRGVRVEQGEYLGERGESGCAKGPHLHIILRNASGKVDSIPGFEGTIISSPVRERRNASPILEDIASATTCNTEGGYKTGEEYRSSNTPRRIGKSVSQHREY